MAQSPHSSLPFVLRPPPHPHRRVRPPTPRRPPGRLRWGTCCRRWRGCWSSPPRGGRSGRCPSSRCPSGRRPSSVSCSVGPGARAGPPAWSPPLTATPLHRRRRNRPSPRSTSGRPSSPPASGRRLATPRPPCSRRTRQPRMGMQARENCLEKCVVVLGLGCGLSRFLWWICFGGFGV